MSFIKKDINKIVKEKWIQYWRKVKQEQQYSKF